jgi:hypothetical protein
VSGAGEVLPRVVGFAKLEIEGGPVWSVYRRSLMGWEPPHQADDLDRAKLDEILERLSACLVVLCVPNRIDRAVRTVCHIGSGVAVKAKWKRQRVEGTAIAR